MVKGHHCGFVEGPVIRPGALEKEEIAASLLEAFKNLTLAGRFEKLLPALILKGAAVLQAASLGDSFRPQMCKMQAIVEQHGRANGITGAQSSSFGDISTGGVQVR